MAYKHQAHCFRNIEGIRYENKADLIYSDEENSKIIAEVRAEFKNVRLIKHKDGFTQLFAA